MRHKPLQRHYLLLEDNALSYVFLFVFRTVSVENPVCIIAKFKGDQLSEGGRNGLILFRIRPAVACKDLHIVHGNTKSAGKLGFGYVLFGYNLIQSV